MKKTHEKVWSTQDQAIDHFKWLRAVKESSQKLNVSDGRIIKKQTKGDCLDKRHMFSLPSPLSLCRVSQN